MSAGRETSLEDPGDSPSERSLGASVSPNPPSETELKAVSPGLRQPPETATLPAANLQNANKDVLALIDKALNLKADAETMERLLGMQERIWARDAEIAFNAAKGRILKRLSGIKIIKSKPVLYELEKGNPKKGLYEAFRYVPLEEIDRVIAPLLAEEEMDLAFSDEPMADGRVMIRGRLKHLPGGHHEDSFMAAPLDTSGGKNNVQAVGSTNSYLRRYVVCNIFNIVVAGADDDGVSAELMTDKQVGEIVSLLKQAKVNGTSFCKYMQWPFDGTQTWTTIVSGAPRRDFNKARVTLEEHIAKQETRHADPAS